MEYKRLTGRDNWGGCVTIKNGTSKDEIWERLAELEDKIENGTLVELPCEVGNTAYCIYNNGECDYWIEEELVHDFIITHDGEIDIGTECRMIGKFYRYGVFLNREEAEKKLEELKMDDKKIINEITQDFKMDKEKNKQIEEMAELINIQLPDYGHNFGDCINATEKLYEQDFRKLPEGAVILMPNKIDEYQKAELNIMLSQARKETVEKFISEVEFHAISSRDCDGMEWLTISKLGLRDIARERFGVEVQDE